MNHFELFNLPEVLDIDLENLKNQCIIQIEEISLPDLAKAIYRQEQVYRF